MSEQSLEVHAIKDRSRLGDRREKLLENLEDAIDRASDQDGITWLTSRGKRIAAIVPVDVAEHHLADMREVLSTPVRGGKNRPA